MARCAKSWQTPRRPTSTSCVVVESVVVREPEILYELGSGGSNLARLQKNAEGEQENDKNGRMDSRDGGS